MADAVVAALAVVLRDIADAAISLPPPCLCPLGQRVTETGRVARISADSRIAAAIALRDKTFFALVAQFAKASRAALRRT